MKKIIKQKIMEKKIIIEIADTLTKDIFD